MGRAFNESELSKVLDLPDHLRPVAIIPVGYAEKIPAQTSRIPKEELVVWMR